MLLKILALIILSLTTVGCGYLDTDLTMDEESWDESFGTGGLSVSGASGFGCGGGIGFGRRSHGYSSMARRMGTGATVMQLGPAYIQGTLPGLDRASDEAAASSEPSYRPRGWVGHFDRVSSERQNVMIAAWIEEQLDEESDDELPSNDAAARPHSEVVAAP